MCDKCNVLKEIFKSADSNSHQNYIPTLAFIKEMVGQGRIEMIAGDCALDEVGGILSEEIHYTICHYFRCLSCNQYFFIGACIRGKPNYKIINDWNNVNLDNMLWGHYGTVYEQNKNTP